MKNRYLWTALLVIFCTTSFAAQTIGKKTPGKQPVVKKIDYSEIYEDKWLRYASNKYSTFYYNPSKASREGSLMRLWSLARDKSDEAIISKTYYEVHCNLNKVRMLAGAVYFEILYTAGGERIRLAITPDSFDTPDGPLRTVVPDTVIEDLYKVACKDDW